MALSPTLNNLFDHSAPIDRAAAGVDGRMTWRDVPAKMAVYLLTGPGEAGEQSDHTFLLATVGNLRAALQRRLADDPPELKTKRVQYGQVCTQVHWRRVYSPFAANWWYWHAARTLFPENYKAMIAWRPTWWVAVEKQAEFPRLRRTQDLADPSLQYAGPIRDKHAAGRLIEAVEDLFDLCRYHHILVQAPHGKACAYKEMGKCPAPCDGSVPLSWYHDQVRHAFRFMTGETRAQWRENTQALMQSVAAQLAFERAARIKERLARAALLETESFAHLMALRDFAFLALQPGQGKPYIEPWLIHPGANPPVQCLPQIKKKELPAAAESLLARCRELAALPIAVPVGAAAAEQIALLAHHLFKGKDDPGVYLRLHSLTAAGPLLQAMESLLRRKEPAKPLAEQSSDASQAEASAPSAQLPAEP